MSAWDDFDRAARRDFPEIVFADDALVARAHPFNRGLAERLHKLLGMLSALKRAIGPDGSHTDEWNERWTQWVKGGELFSDESASNKRDFARELTFNHPANPGTKLSCPWHAKENGYKFRIHFSYPIRHDEPLYVVYIGPKITRK